MEEIAFEARFFSSAPSRVTLARVGSWRDVWRKEVSRALILGGCLLWGTTTRGETSTSGVSVSERAASVPTLVVVVPEQQSPVPIKRLIAALEAHLSELGVEVRLSDEQKSLQDHGQDSEQSNVLAFVWIQSEAGKLSVHLDEPTGARFQERRIPLSRANAANVEEVAVIVRSAAAALLARSSEPRTEAEVQREQERLQSRAVEPSNSLESSDRAVASPESSSSRELFEVAAAYTGALFASELSWRHGVSLCLAWAPGLGPWRVRVRYAFLSPILVQSSEVR